MKHDYTLQSTGTARMFRYTNETLQLNESGQFSNQLFLANNNGTKIQQQKWPHDISSPRRPKKGLRVYFYLTPKFTYLHDVRKKIDPHQFHST